MRRIVLALCVVIAVSVGLLAQQPVKLVDSTGTDVPLSATTEVAHDAALGTLTLVTSLMELCRTSSTVPSSATGSDRAFLAWCNLAGSRAAFLTASDVGGCTPGKLVSAATTNATSVKGSAGQVYTVTASNTNAAVRYLKLYNKATAPTVGTDTPVQTIALPPSGANPPQLGSPVGLSFSTGIAFALTTGAADSDTAAVAANEILVNYCYK